MPLVSRFFGVLIYIYFKDHAPPHFHAMYGEHEALIEIESLKVYRGSLPRVQLALATAWGSLRQHELINAWNAAVKGKHPGRILPLEGRKKKSAKKGKK